MRTSFLLPAFAIILHTQAMARVDFAGPDQFICGTATMLAANTLSPGESGFWSVVSGTATFVSGGSPTSPVIGLSFGENVLQWTVITSSGPASDQMSVWCYNSAMPAADAGADQNVSDPPGFAQLSGSVPIPPGTCVWTLVAGSGTISAPTDPQATVAFLGMGTSTFQWSCDNGPCGVTSDIVQVDVTVVGIEEAAAQALEMRYDPTGRRLIFGPRSAKLAVDLFDEQGRLVFQVATPSGTGSWDLSALPAGLFLVRATSGGQTRTLRFVVGH